MAKTDLKQERIDAVYAAPLEAFIAERDALAKALKDEGDDEGAKRVKALRKPVVPAWAVNRLAREEAEGIAELLALGERLRAGQRRAISGGDVDALREALDERRRLVARLVHRAEAILSREGSGGTHESDIASTLEAAAADEEAGELVRTGRLTKPLRPPATFGEGGLRVLEGGRRTATAVASAGARASRDDEASTTERERDREQREERRRLERELATARTRERKASEAVDRAKARLADLERRRGEAREALRSAETESRGAALERKRLEARIERGS